MCVQNASIPKAAAPGDMIACPECDALLRAVPLGPTERARCPRCGSLLVSPRVRSFLQVVALAFTALILMMAAVFFPFLGIAAHGLAHESSVIEVALAFSDGWLAPLSVAVLAVIVGLPMLRFCAIIYVLWPLANGRPAWPKARAAFRLAESLTPWSMAEIFIVGTAVALVKIGGLAAISIGPAFWAFCGLVIVTTLKNAFMSRWSIWTALERS